MSPTINYGGLVVVFKTPFSQVGNNSIIVFRDPRGNPGTYIHRVVAVTHDCGGSNTTAPSSVCFVTKGDNEKTNPTVDPWVVTQQYYLGQVILVVPYAGYVSPMLWGFKGLAALLPIAFVLFLALFFTTARRRTGG